jgi:hypothetical protein
MAIALLDVVVLIVGRLAGRQLCCDQGRPIELVRMRSETGDRRRCERARANRARCERALRARNRDE